MNNVQVRFKNKETPIDFIILEPTVKGNIILGRSFLRAMRCFIDVKNGHILFWAPIKGKSLFPKIKKSELVEIFNGPLDFDDELIYATWSFVWFLAKGIQESAYWEGTQDVFTFSCVLFILLSLGACYFCRNSIVSLFSSFVPSFSL